MKDEDQFEPVPDWALERYRLGELEEGRRAQVERALADATEAARLEARLEALAASDAEILARYPPRAVRARVEVVLERERRRQGGPLLGLLAVAAALLLVARAPTEPPEQAPPIDRVKGLRPQLHVYREGQREPLPQGASAREGDVLQLSFVRGEMAHGAIVSIDGRGAVTVHAPALPPSDEGGATPLPQALTLDDAPSFERFFLVTGNDPVPLDTLTQAALRLAQDPMRAQTAPLPLPPSFQQTDRLLRKEDSP